MPSVDSGPLGLTPSAAVHGSTQVSTPLTTALEPVDAVVAGNSDEHELFSGKTLVVSAQATPEAPPGAHAVERPIAAEHTLGSSAANVAGHEINPTVPSTAPDEGRSPVLSKALTFPDVHPLPLVSAPILAVVAAAVQPLPLAQAVAHMPPPAPSMVPTPVTFHNIDYVPQQVISRLQNIVRVREVAANRYALLTVPRAADWGRGPRTEKILCIGGKPILIWLIGRVRSLWFFDRNGDPHLRVNIGISLHSGEERAAAMELYGRARPRADSVPDTVYAGRICSHREKGEYCDTATAFTQVYDATTRLTAKSAMPQLSPVDLGKNDLVVLECTFSRWKRANEGKAKKSWGSYDVGFELSSIFLLHSAPADLADDHDIQVEEDIAVEY
ncbi:hypothetical protein C2E23DRAFT_885221 [Lenzites betulinus]|nr:hypothetical protein C2E23DRAFT_885221 [Lenzites betulinus]